MPPGLSATATDRPWLHCRTPLDIAPLWREYASGRDGRSRRRRRDPHLIDPDTPLGELLPCPWHDMERTRPPSAPPSPGVRHHCRADLTVCSPPPSGHPEPPGPATPDTSTPRRRWPPLRSEAHPPAPGTPDAGMGPSRHRALKLVRHSRARGNPCAPGPNGFPRSRE